jgi:hypothetical protein
MAGGQDFPVNVLYAAVVLGPASLARSHLVETYDLIQRAQCWHPEIITHPRFAEFVREVKNCFRSL